ncbi:TolC family protein [Occallatibacter riparius]|uniref:TolC family protein n=1 Tax=Occallatibacter riparius TaxID=1002689 RepID=A0A9J7BRV6_9BACT|nr:TolC family protein [Occallatibacter riparius]UWZ85400.1 TolC family protein [Occallatibacter riparius]
MSIDEALAIAEQNSPLLKQSQAQIEAGQGRVEAARAYSNPTVQVLAGHQAGLDVPTPGVPGLLQHYSASQPIEIPAERQARIRAARLAMSADKDLLLAVRLGVMANVKRAFYDVIRRKEQLANAEGNLALVTDLRRRVGVEVKVGEKGKLELTRAEAEMSRARAVVKSAEVELAAARAVLKAVLGMPVSESPEPSGSFSPQITLPALEQLRQSVLANHPALSEAQTRTEEARAIVQDERARRIPTPQLYGEYEHQPDLSFFRMGVNIDIPVWNRRRGQIREAAANVARSTSAERQTQLELVAALERAYSQYEISSDQVESLQAGSLREAEAAVEAARAAYKFGERGIVEVLDAQRVLQGVRTDLLDARYAQQSALIDLEELGATHP